MTGQSNALRIADDIAATPFAFPGGYRRHAATDDGGLLCSECCKTERYSIGTSYAGDGRRVVGDVVLWEGGPRSCDSCGVSYASEYGGGPQ